jgi:hypothetical protein
VNLQAAVIEIMDELGDDNGAERERVVAATVDRFGVEPAAVEDAIQDALMSGECYEVGDGLKTI